MLRISNLGSEEKLTRLQLDGRLSGPWVEELLRICEAALQKQSALAVDCGGLFFADAAGVDLLRSPARPGRCSGELLGLPEVTTARGSGLTEIDC